MSRPSQPDLSAAGPPPRPPAFRTSPLLFSYVAREFALPLLCGVLAFTALFVIMDLLDYLQEFLSGKAPIPSVVLFFLVRQPVNLIQILPMAILLASSYMICNLTRHHEITAVRAAGVSILHCCLPVWILAGLLSLASLWLNESIVPYCSKQSEMLLEKLSSPHQKPREKERRLAFRNRRANRDWLFERFSSQGLQQGVIVKQFRADNSLDWELRAASAEFRNRSWHFHQATLTRYKTGDLLPSGPGQEFEHYTNPDLSESPDIILNSLQPAEELSALQLNRLLRDKHALPKTTRDIFRTTFWYRLSFPFSCLMAALLGVGFSLTEERGSAMRGLAMAIGLIFLYHTSGQIMLLLGKSGRIPPLLAGTTPTIAFSAWGAYILVRKR